MQSISRASVISASSSRVLQEVAAKSQSRIFSLEGFFNDEQIRVVWNAFGLYLSKNMRMGRGVNVPKFGIFTFTPPEVRLHGVTNPEDRDQRPRNPIFVVSKQFVKGKDLKPGIFYHQEFGSGIRPYTVYGSNGQVPVAKINLTEVSSYANMSKDSVELALNRILKHLSEKTGNTGSCSIDIPNIGTFFVRNNLVAVKFNQFIQRDTRNVLSQSLDHRRQRADMQLTSDNLKKFAILAETSSKLAQKPLDFLKIDQGAKDYLKKDFGLHFDESTNLRRTVTNFDRTVATKQFNNKAQALRESHLSKFRQSRMNRTGLSQSAVIGQSLKYDYNMALKLLKEWIYSNSYSSQSSFSEFMNRAKGRKNVKQMLTQDDIWKGCKAISIDITEQQAHELFRILDVNKDGVVSIEQWAKVIKFDSNALLSKVIGFIQSNKLTVPAVISKMGINGLTSIDMFRLQTALKQLCGSLNDEQAQNLSRYITKGENSVSIDDLKHVLQLADEFVNHIKVDEGWRQKFLERIKRNMLENEVFEEELQNRFAFYDNKHSGVITQAQFKDVLTSIGVVLTLPELIKAVKSVGSQSKNQIKYHQIIDKLRQINIENVHKDQISFAEFLKKIEEPFLRKKPRPVALPLSLVVLASDLQAKYFPEQTESTIRKHLKLLDLDHNGQISNQDLDAYIRRLDSEALRNSQDVPTDLLEKLIQDIKQQSYKKRISFHNLFKMLDVNQDGFVSQDQFSNVEKILPMPPYLRQALFKYMDRSNLSMIDYKTFLQLLEGGGSKTNMKHEKFDWVKDCLSQIRQWYSKSNLLPGDAFKVVDRDFDGYVTEKDLVTFLNDTLKYQHKQLTHIRIQKLFKLMDTYKRGKIDLVDFKKLISKQHDSDGWLNNASQQIGLAISRKYNSISQAFNDISKDEKNLVFANFQKWVTQHNILAGFMMNQSMLKELFAALDPHKKGYLSQSDFLTAFGKYEWKSSMVLEFVQTLQAKFGSQKEAYKHLSGYKGHKLNYQQFYNSVREIFGNRFHDTDIQQIWSQLAGKDTILSAERFSSIVNSKGGKFGKALDEHYPRDDWVYQDYDIIKGTVNRSLQHTYQDKDQLQHQCRRIVQVVKDILRTSPKTLQQAFKQADRGGRGVVTNLEFKHAFRILNIALTSREIDLLLNFCDFSIDKLINYKQFIKKFNNVGEKKKILDRVQTKMQKFSDILHYYLISPKDAFRKYNNPSTGYMNFEEFYTLVKDAYKLANEALPQYAIIKQLFEFIDVRKDEHLDYQEWVQTFRNHNPPSQIQGTRQPVLGKQVHEQSKSPVRLQPLPNFQQSKQFEDFTNFIGRNRKYLLEKIEALEHKTPLIEYSAVEKILKEVAEQHHMNYESAIYRNFVAFAMTGEKVDYKLLLDAFKQRSETIQDFPKHKVF